MEIHNKRVKKAKLQATVDVHKPRSLHYTRNANKTQLLREERFTEIERENRILFEKMARIMTRKETPFLRTNVIIFYQNNRYQN